jgi:tetraacyldisaccharide 4'-kinase
MPGWRRRLFGPVLAFLSRWYGAGLRLVQGYYREHPDRVSRVSARIVSVGNITWGGTGKTPLVMFLAKALSARGKRVAVLTRGYGQDEEHELKSGLTGVPIHVGRDRVRNAQRAVQENQAEILILDDGFQHWRLHRNCDVVTINATNAFGNEKLIPSGTLREPLANLARADVFVLTNATLGRNNVTLIRQRLKDLNPRALVFEADHEPARFVDVFRNEAVGLGLVRGRRVAVLSGIEDPLSFERTVERLGAEIVFAARFNDHHAFTRSEIREVLAATRDLEAEYLVTTNKDYYRLGRVLKAGDTGGLPILVLQIELHLDDEDAFIRRCANL